MTDSQMTFMTPETLQDVLPLAVGIGILVFAGLGIDIWLLIRISSARETLTKRAIILRQTLWTWREGLALGLLALLLNQVALVSIKAVEWFSGSTTASLAMAILLQTAWIPLCLLALVLTLLRKHETTWKEAFGLTVRPPMTAIGGALRALLALFPPLVLTAILSQFILTRFNIPVHRQLVVDLLLDPDQPHWLRMHLCFAAVVIAPAIEEIAFRGILLPALARDRHWGSAAAWVAILFAAVHFNAASLLPLFVLAIGLSLAYIVSGTLWLPILMHSIFNALSLALIFLTDRFQ